MTVEEKSEFQKLFEQEVICVDCGGLKEYDFWPQCWSCFQKSQDLLNYLHTVKYTRWPEGAEL